MALNLKNKGAEKASFGKLFLASSVKDGTPFDLLAKGDVSELMTETELPVYQFIVGHIQKHGVIPDVQTIAQHTGVDLSIIPVKEPSSYYRGLMSRRYVERQLKNTILQVQEDHFGDLNKDPREAIPILYEALGEIMRNSTQQEIVDYRKASPLLMAEYKKDVFGDNSDNMLTGWPKYDSMSGGIAPGDYLSIVGRPMAGKSWLIIWIAYICWLNGRTVLVVSMEMTSTLVLQRLSAINANISMGKLKNGSGAGLSSKEYKTYQDTLLNASQADNGFYVVDMNLTGQVSDIEHMVEVTQPDVVLIDGGYLLKHPKVRDRYARVAENAELLKQTVAKRVPLAVSWQFSRDAVKGKKANAPDATLEDIGYTDVIGQVSSIVLGLMQDETVETLHRKRVGILKGRHGESGHFEINWNFQKMDFSEYTEPKVQDLKYL